MLEGEPSWLAVLGPGGPRTGPNQPPLSFPSGHSRHALHLHLGGDPQPPAVAEHDEAVVVLDGTLLDRRPLASRLGARTPTSNDSDAALVLAAYLELGERLLPLLRGSFGLLIWDRRRTTLFCIRDPTDSHPLFLSRGRDSLLVSASHGALLDVGRVPADLDRTAIARWVVGGSALPPRTFYSRIERLPPGHVLRAAPDRLALRRYWHPGESPPNGELTPDDAVERLEELLDQAVARCASRGPLGVFLSGGVDSAVVTASAAAVSRRSSLPDPVALCCAYPAEGSEELAQRSVAKGLGIPHRLVPLLDTVCEDGLLEAALRLSERSWTPPVNPWEPAYLDLARRGGELGCRVIMSGEGGNDWLEAEWYEAADLIRHLSLGRLARLWSQERRAGWGGSETARALLWTYGARVVARDAALGPLGRVAGPAVRARHRRRTLASVGSPWALPDHDLRCDFAEELVDTWPAGRPRSYRDFANDRKLEGVHLVVSMENRFLFSRTADVELLNPVTDPDLVAFLYWLPSVLLNYGGRGKGLAWESVRRRAGDKPARLLGFASVDGFFANLIRAEAPRALERMGGLARLSELGVVDGPAFERALGSPGAGTQISSYKAWQALACEAWLR